MISERKYYQALNIVEQYRREQIILNVDDKLITSESSIRDVIMSVRLRNVLMGNHLTKPDFKIKRLSGMSITEFKRYRNVGKRSVQELDRICFIAGVELQP